MEKNIMTNWFFDNLSHNREIIEKDRLDIDCCICEKSNKSDMLFKIEIFWNHPKNGYEYKLGSWFICAKCRVNDKK